MHQTTPPRYAVTANDYTPARATTAASTAASTNQRPWPSRRQAALGMAGALLLATLPACAPRLPAAAPPVSMVIVDRDTGQPLTTYFHHSQGHVAGRPGARYTLRVTNRSAGRVLVVLSVDGINVISGETASVDQVGYVLGPWQTSDITGWRKSDTTVAGFVFAALDDSYAARTGRPDDVGVIGLATFLEKPPPPAVRPRQADIATAPSAAAGVAPAPAARAESPAKAAGESTQHNDRLGTGHGETEGSVVRSTAFERRSRAPQDRIEIRYDSRANLVRAGIIPAFGPAPQARAFPADNAPGFVPDPPPR